MGVPVIVWILGGAGVLIIAAIVGWLVLQSRRVNLTGSESPDQKPEWMRTTPPPETRAATQADGQGVAVYDYDAGEHVAAPFAEQIEDIARAFMNADPALAAMDVDLGTTPEGGLEIWVNGERYTDLSQLPSERLRQVFQQAIERWEQRQV